MGKTRKVQKRLATRQAHAPGHWGDFLAVAVLRCFLRPLLLHPAESHLSQLSCVVKICAISTPNPCWFAQRNSKPSQSFVMSARHSRSKGQKGTKRGVALTTSMESCCICCRWAKGREEGSWKKSNLPTKARQRRKLPSQRHSATRIDGDISCDWRLKNPSLKAWTTNFNWRASSPWTHPRACRKVHQWRHQVSVLIQENDRSSPQICEANRMRLDEANNLSFSSSSRSSISAARVLKRQSTFVVRAPDAAIYHQIVSAATLQQQDVCPKIEIPQQAVSAPTILQPSRISYQLDCILAACNMFA